jgi:N utilization substance protein B
MAGQATPSIARRGRVKGRRRARHAALQALYELDTSGHSLELVMEERVRELYRSAAAQALERSHRSAVETLIDEYAAHDFGDVPVETVAAMSRADVTVVEAALECLRDLVPHVAYLQCIVRGVWSNRAVIDKVVARIAPEWPVEQMAPVDRNVLRIAIWEMATGATPVRVAINEAVELARLFSGEASRRMVNGALGTYVAGGTRLELEPG